MQVTSKPPTSQAPRAPCPSTAGKNSPAMPSHCTSAATAPTSRTARALRANKASLARPSQGSTTASTRRTAISKTPTVASGKPKLRA